MKPYVTYKQLNPLDKPEEQLPPEQGTLPAHKRARWAVLATVLAAMLLAALFTYPLVFLAGSTPSRQDRVRQAPGDACTDPCRITLVESIPEGLTYGSAVPSHPSTFQTWLELIGGAQSSLDIASFYWTLTNADTHTREPSAQQGEQILAELTQLPQRGVAVRVAVSTPKAKQPLDDLEALERSGAAVRKVDLPRLTKGVLHTKFWVVDGAHIYLGSANMDWRSLTQVKELGAAVYNCSCLARDLGKVFEAYWALGVPDATIPEPWPDSYSTIYNVETPLQLQLNGTPASVYLSSSPPALCARGRTEDLRALLTVIDTATDFVHIAVMSYLPTMEFSRPKRFWPAIDNHLRRAAYERGVSVRLLVSCWSHSKPPMFPFLKSLAALQDNRTRYSVEVHAVPLGGPGVGAGVTAGPLVGTSNWSGDYFVQTAGSALVLDETGAGATVGAQLQAVFQRDWDSPYSTDLGSLARWESLCQTH
ncbi:phospholipase D3 [Alligator sinensis]|uniref:5'-3' exonuclease PLD3 n=1 Tax=Alligator sinensis TaxID=38654 RepID=A0A3Q0HB64_ALLSI|nr:phospholipase D3 [Alligator sinensis]